MNLFRVMRFLSSILFVGFVGCGAFPESLTTEEDSRIDPGLEGSWMAMFDKDDEPEALTITANSNTKVHTLQAGSDPDSVTFTVTRIGDHDFISVPTSIGPPGWLVLRYKWVSTDEVQIFAMEDEKVAEAIRAGLLSGEIKRVMPLGLFGVLFGVKSTAEISKMYTSRIALREFLTLHPDDCFDLSKPTVVLNRKPRQKTVTIANSDTEQKTLCRHKSPGVPSTCVRGFQRDAQRATPDCRKRVILRSRHRRICSTSLCGLR